MIIQIKQMYFKLLYILYTRWTRHFSIDNNNNNNNRKVY